MRQVKKHRGKIKELSSILDSELKKLVWDFEIKRPETFSEDVVKKLIAGTKMEDPLSLGLKLNQSDHFTFVHELKANLLIYLDILVEFIIECAKRNIRPAKPLRDIIEKNREAFQSEFKRPFKLYEISGLQAYLLLNAIIPIAEMMGAYKGLSAAKLAIQKETTLELDRVTKRLLKKHWLTDVGYMELLLELNPSSSREELEMGFLRMRISKSNRKKFWATHPKYRKKRDEWWIYKTKNGEHLYDKPNRTKGRTVLKMGIEGVEEAMKQVLTMNRQNNRI